jgi:precorrin-8X/cobalt-precorrin-8 methylmutase
MGMGTGMGTGMDTRSPTAIITGTAMGTGIITGIITGTGTARPSGTGPMRRPKRCRPGRAPPERVRRTAADAVGSLSVPIFDAYIMVDWSAAGAPVRGRGSIWIACLEREADGARTFRLENPPTRDAAILWLADRLSDLVARDRVTLAGFDFAFGYPAGFAARLRPDSAAKGGPAWRAVWNTLAATLSDRADNRNDRFAAAAALNARLSGRAFPFWGCPIEASGPHLGTRKPDGFGTDGWKEFRIADRVTGGPKSVWQLAYAGSVGSQSLLGIPRLHALRHHPWLAAACRIWPFETGMAPLARPTSEAWRVLLAEVYPSMLQAPANGAEVLDAAQVRTLAQHFGRLDEAGRLGALFGGPRALCEEALRRVEDEEGWILGIETAAPNHRPACEPKPAAPPRPPRRHDYLRDPHAIYRRSFEIVRAEAGLEGLPAPLRPIAQRMIHACGDVSIVDDLAYTDPVVSAARAALAAGAPILVDANMVRAGIIAQRLPAANRIVCTLDAPDNPQRAKALRTTRSAVAVDDWGEWLEGSVVAIGNAPTALFRLLELLEDGAPRPAAILGFPVGFVGAAESKEALIASDAGVPFLTLRGRRGGSALAAAAVNALGEEPA